MHESVSESCSGRDTSRDNDVRPALNLRVALRRAIEKVGILANGLVGPGCEDHEGQREPNNYDPLHQHIRTCSAGRVILYLHV